MAKKDYFIGREDLKEMKQYAKLAPLSYDIFNDYYSRFILHTPQPIFIERSEVYLNC